MVVGSNPTGYLVRRSYPTSLRGSRSPLGRTWNLNAVINTELERLLSQHWSRVSLGAAKWVKAFKNGPNKIVWRQSLKNVKFKAFLKAVFHKIYLVLPWISWPKKSLKKIKLDVKWQVTVKFSTLFFFHFRSLKKLLHQPILCKTLCSKKIHLLFLMR